MHSSLGCRAEQPQILCFAAASACDKQHAPCMTRQQACPFPAGVVSLVSGEVKHVVHPIRWNLTAVICQLGQDLTTCLEWLNARLLGLGTESCLWNFHHRFSFCLFEQCTRGLLLRHHGLLRRNIHLLLRRGHNHRRVHICLDNLRHCILHGLLRPHLFRLLQLHPPCHSHHWPQLLMQYQLPTSCLQWLHPWLRKPPWCTLLHRLSLLPRHPLFQLHGTLLKLHPTHRRPHRHHCRAHRTHLVPFIPHRWPKLLHFLQKNLDNLQSRPPRSFDPRRNLTNYAVQLQKPHYLFHRLNQQRHLHHPSHQSLQHWVLLHNNLQNRSVLSKLNNRWSWTPNALKNNVNNFSTKIYLQLALHCLHHHLQRHYPHPCLHLHRKRDPLNLKFRTTSLSRFQPFLLLTIHLHQHRHHADHDPGLEDHAPVDHLLNLITDDIPLTVRIDLVLPFPDIVLRPNMTRIAEHLPHTDEDHHPDGVHQLLIDVIVLILDHAPDLLVAIPEAEKSSYDQPYVQPIQTSFLHLTLMTPGASGATAIILTNTITAQIGPYPLQDHHHHPIHHQTHQHTQQHHLEPWPFVSRTETAKTQMQLRHFPSQSSTRMTSNSARWLRLPMIHFVYDAWLSLTLTIQSLSAQHWTNKINCSSTISWTRCSTSWLNHIAPSTTNLFSSKQAKPPSWILPGPLHNPDYLTSIWQRKHEPFMWNRRTCWPSRCQRGCPGNRSIVANTRAPTWSTTKRVGRQLPRSLLKIAFARQLGQKMRRAFRLNTHVTGSSACPLRFRTSMTYQAMLSSYVHLSSTA